MGEVIFQMPHVASDLDGSPLAALACHTWQCLWEDVVACLECAAAFSIEPLSRKPQQLEIRCHQVRRDITAFMLFYFNSMKAV